MKPSRLVVAAALLIIGGCGGRQSAPQQVARTAAVLDQYDLLSKPVVLRQSDPCYARVAGETQKMLGIAPSRITRSQNTRFMAGTKDEHIIALYSAADKAPPCQHLVAITVVPPAGADELILMFPDFSVSQVDVKPSSASGSATIVVTDKAGRQYVRKLVSRPFAFIVEYHENYLDLLAPGPDAITHEISSDTNGRILYRISFRHGFSIKGPVYHI